MRVVDLGAGQTGDVPIHPLFEMTEENQSVVAPHQVGKLLVRARRLAFQAAGGIGQVSARLGAGNEQHAVSQPLMAILDVVVVVGRMLGEHDHAHAGRLGGGDNFFDRAAAVVRKGRVDVQQRPHVVVAAL